MSMCESKTIFAHKVWIWSFLTLMATVNSDLFATLKFLHT